MNPLKSLETTLASLVEGAFGRVFRSEVRPMELARKLAREMDEHRTASVSRVYAPNEYAVWLSPAGPRPLRGRRGRGDRRALRLPARARAPRGAHARLATRIIAFHTDESPVARRVRHPGAAGAPRRPRRGGWRWQPRRGRRPRRGVGAARPRGLACPGRRRAAGGRARAHDDLQLLRAPARAARAGPRAPPPACPAAGRRAAPAGRLRKAR